MHKIIKSLLAAASILGVGVGGVSATATRADAQTFADLQREAELACEEALRKGTIEALEEYLWKYPYANNACRAKALSAVQEFSPNTDYQNGPEDRPEDGDYGN